MRFIFTFLATLCMIMPATGYDMYFHTFGADEGMLDNSVQTLLCLPDGRIVMSVDGRINIYDGALFTNIDAGEANIYSLPDYKGNYHIYLDRYHHIWLKQTGGVTCVDQLSEFYINNIDSVFKAFGATDAVRDFFVTTDGCVWYVIGRKLFGYETGISIVLPRGVGDLQDIDVYDGRQLLLFFGDGKVYAYDMKTSQLLYHKSAYPDEEAVHYAMSSVILQNAGTVFQLRNGEKKSRLMSFDLLTRSWRVLIDTPYHLNNMVALDGVLYIPCEYGYWTYDTKSGAVNHYEKIMLWSGATLATDINAACFDHQCGLWLGTERRGLLYAKPYKRPVTIYTWDKGDEALGYERLMDTIRQHTEYLGNTCYCLYNDTKGRTWVGTNNGLKMYRKKKLIAHYGLADGMLNEVVHSIVEDTEGNIWVATSNGITALLFKGDDLFFLNNYSSSDRVPNEGFVDGRALCLNDGSVVMQGYDHVIKFLPTSFRTLHDFHAFPLSPVLVRMKLKGETLTVGKKYGMGIMLSRAPSFIDTLQVDYDDNMLSMTFSCMNYYRPGQTYYRCRIREIDNKWIVHSPNAIGGDIDGFGQFHLAINNFKPGTYHIEVQASMYPFVWNGKTKVTTLIISQPWWRAIGTYLSMAVVLVVLLCLVLFLYSKNLKLKIQKNNTDSELLQRLRRYFGRINNLRQAVLTPSTADMGGEERQSANDLNDDERKKMRTLYAVLDDNEHTSLEEYSQRADLPLSEVYKMAGHCFERSPYRLILQLRLERAARLLTETDKTPDEVANMCHFITGAYFRRSFERFFHLSPEEYVKQKNTNDYGTNT